MVEMMKDASERAFQDRFVYELEKYQWKSLPELDGTKQKVTVEDLIAHWREELNRINQDQLEGVALTDGEFKQVLAKVSQITNSYEAAKLLAIEEGKGKIDGIYRDSNPNITREQITLTIFKKAAVRGGDSSYAVAREVVSEKTGNRFDIVLLINGLPLINIEQKRTDKTLDEAFGQFKRYYRDGEYSNNFMAFSQMMVITSEIDTRYFATPKSYQDFNESFVFRWSDKNNRAVTKFQDIIGQFLMIPMAHQMVGDYLIIDEALEEENKRHMLMRPYQVHALQAVEGAAFGWDNDGIPHGGFVWHTTGSGKTITSFKTALFLSTRGNFDKVVFLVDRKELDSNTTEKFKSYAYFESVSVDDTKHTYHLQKELEASKRGIVVTTTFKLNNLVEKLIENEDNRLSDKRIVFIIDEAHRTTMGQMMGTIRDYFKKNGLFYGFTGTPLFDENEITGKINEKSEVINTTEKLFGPLLHQYTIDEAIADGNVLGFHVLYFNTGEFESYADLREQLIEKRLKDKPDLSKWDVQKEIALLSDLEVEELAVKEEILIYQDETHIPRVVTEMLDNWADQSQDYWFNAILTVAYKPRVIAYYKEFKKQLAERGEKLNVAMTFSEGNVNNPDDQSLEAMDEMYKDYQTFTGVGFAVRNTGLGSEDYFSDLTSRAKRGGSGRNPHNIDLIIVADRLLTGYDSKLLNTLYVDRPLELQGLIQAYSRTNRIYNKSKEFGTIINFQYPKLSEQAVNQALALYGSGGTSKRAIVEPYDTAVQQFSETVFDLVETMTDPSHWVQIKDNEEAKEAFMKVFKSALDKLNRVMQYYQFEWDDQSFGITKHEWLSYVGAYKNLKPGGDGGVDDTVVNQLTAKTKIASSQLIDAAHIVALIGKEVDTQGDVQTVSRETQRIIYEQIAELKQMGEAEQAQLLLQFVEEQLIPGYLSTNVNFDQAFAEWKLAKRTDEVHAFAREWGVDAELLNKSLELYSADEKGVVPYMNDITFSADFAVAQTDQVNNRLELTMELTKELPHWIEETKAKYRS